MPFTGKQKAAMLLMNMDPGIAAELLKGIDPDVIQEIAVELARMDASGGSDRKTGAKIAHEFYSSLQKGETANLSIRSFLNDTLSSILDKDLAERIQSQVKKVAETKDLFAEIRSASTDELVLALEGEHPQTIAVVLSELNVKKSQEVLGLLGEEVCVRTVCRLTNPEPLGGRVRERIASMITKRLGSFKGETVSKKPDEHLRKLAITLSGLERDLRDRLLDEIGKHDEETSTTVRRLMITWEDIPTIADRSLQEALRGVESKTLAVALYGADEDIREKIRSNISERAAAALDEESSLMQEPLENEVLEAREGVVEPLRNANEEGTLRRVKG